MASIEKTDGRKGNSGGARAGAGRKPGPHRRRRLTKDAALALRLLAWGRYERPTTDEEEDAVLSALVMEEQERMVADPREGFDIDF